MTIPRKLLRALDFMEVGPSEHSGWSHEVWLLDSEYITVYVGYDQKEVPPEQHIVVDGDADSIVGLFKHIMASYEEYINELRAGDDW